jgi:hypothetical protein
MPRKVAPIPEAALLLTEAERVAVYARTRVPMPSSHDFLKCAVCNGSRWRRWRSGTIKCAGRCGIYYFVSPEPQRMVAERGSRADIHSCYICGAGLLNLGARRHRCCACGNDWVTPPIKYVHLLISGEVFERLVMRGRMSPQGTPIKRRVTGKLRPARDLMLSAKGLDPKFDQRAGRPMKQHLTRRGECATLFSDGGN